MGSIENRVATLERKIIELTRPRMKTLRKRLKVILNPSEAKIVNYLWRMWLLRDELDAGDVYRSIYERIINDRDARDSLPPGFLSYLSEHVDFAGGDSPQGGDKK